MTKKSDKVGNVPNLRFPRFSDDWQQVRFGEIVNFKVTNSYSRDDLNYLNGAVKNIHYGDIHTKYQTLFDITKENVPYINNEIAIGRISEDNYCKEGDILFADASEDLTDVGKSIEIINLNNEKVLSGLHTLLARPKENVFHSGFVGYLLKSNSVRIQIQKVSQGSKVLSINVGRLSTIMLTIPSFTEQKEITGALRLIELRIQTQNKIIEGLKFFKSRLGKRIFNQELRFVDDINSKNDWEPKKLGDLCDIMGGGTPETNKHEYWNGDIQWFTPTEIKMNYVMKSQRTITKLGLNNSSAKLLPPGAILLTTRATIGEVAIALEECSTNQGFQSLIVKEGVSNLFIFNWLKENKFELKKRSNGSTFPEISKSAIEKITICIPSLSEQMKIANSLSLIEEKIEKEKKILAVYQKQKQYLLKNLFI
jgi:type I restriction enzyme S subunit